MYICGVFNRCDQEAISKLINSRKRVCKMKNIRTSVMSFFNKIKSLFSNFGDAMKTAWQLAKGIITFSKVKTGEVRKAIVSGYGKEVGADGLLKFYEVDKGWRSCYVQNIILSK